MKNEDLKNIEAALAHQERQIQDMSDMISAQWAEIDRLKKRLERAEGKITLLESGAADGGEGLSISEIAARDKPPHY